LFVLLVLCQTVSTKSVCNSVDLQGIWTCRQVSRVSDACATAGLMSFNKNASRKRRRNSEFVLIGKLLTKEDFKNSIAMDS
jgi:hypothetical protein